MSPPALKSTSGCPLSGQGCPLWARRCHLPVLARENARPQAIRCTEAALPQLCPQSVQTLGNSQASQKVLSPVPKKKIVGPAPKVIVKLQVGSVGGKGLDLSRAVHGEGVPSPLLARPMGKRARRPQTQAQALPLWPGPATVPFRSTEMFLTPKSSQPCPYCPPWGLGPHWPQCQRP